MFKLIRKYDDGRERDVTYTDKRPITYSYKPDADSMASRMNQGLPVILEIEKPDFRYEVRPHEEKS